MSTRPPPAALRRAGFTLVELLVAAGITLTLAGLVVSLFTGVFTQFTRSTNRLATQGQAALILDTVAQDLQNAMFRSDGQVWLAASIVDPVNSAALTSSLRPDLYWDALSRPFVATPPYRSIVTRPAANGSALVGASLETGTNPDPAARALPFARTNPAAAPPDLAGLRFGRGGVWLRFVTQGSARFGLGANPGTQVGPVVVSYQIVRRPEVASDPTRGTSVLSPRRYFLHRTQLLASNAQPAGVTAVGNQDGLLQSGVHVVNSIYSSLTGPSDPNRDLAFQAPGTVLKAHLLDILANDVIDFGVRFYAYDRSTTPASLRLIFPSVQTAAGTPAPGNSDLNHFATTNGAHTDLHVAERTGAPGRTADDFLFPDVAEVMVRILTAEGAREIQLLEAGLAGPLPARFVSDAVWWWDVATRHSHTYTRRIVMKGRGL